MRIFLGKIEVPWGANVYEVLYEVSLVLDYTIYITVTKGLHT